MRVNEMYPMQPIFDGRFEANPIVDWLCTNVSDMNAIAHYCAENDIPHKYQEQIAQLVGYSVSGYGSLSFVSDESYDRAVNNIHVQPTSQEIEWKNGDECVYKNDEFIFVGVLPVKPSSLSADCVIQNKGGAPILTYIDELSKPESPEEKLKREREENAIAYFNFETQCFREAGENDQLLTDSWDQANSVTKEAYRIMAEKLNFKAN